MTSLFSRADKAHDPMYVRIDRARGRVLDGIAETLFIRRCLREPDRSLNHRVVAGMYGRDSQPPEKVWWAPLEAFWWGLVATLRRGLR